MAARDSRSSHIGEGGSSVIRDYEARTGSQIDIVAIKERSADQRFAGTKRQVEFRERSAPIIGDIDRGIACYDDAVGMIVVRPKAVSGAGGKGVSRQRLPCHAAIGRLHRRLDIGNIGNAVGDQRIACEADRRIGSGLDLRAIGSGITIAEIRGPVQPAHVAGNIVFVGIGGIDRRGIQRASTAHSTAYP